MPTIAQQLEKLIELKSELVSNLNDKGIEASPNETFNTLVPKVLDIQSGSSGGTDIMQLKLDNTKNASYLFSGYTGDDVSFLSSLDFSNVTNMDYMFNSCEKITSIPEMNTQNVTSMKYIFSKCYYITEVTDKHIDTKNVTNVSNMFDNCSRLITAGPFDFGKATTIGSSFITNCSKLENLTLLNIKRPLSLGYSSGSMGTKLTLESLINTCKECIKQSSTYKLTLGITNMEKLSNVYVKFTNPSQTSIATDQKGEVEVCESTDTGAMLISNYMTLKNWSLVA